MIKHNILQTEYFRIYYVIIFKHLFLIIIVYVIINNVIIVKIKSKIIKIMLCKK